jgi:hypothetical protein
MGMGASPLRRARGTRAGLGAIACALMVVAATPAFAQAPLTPDLPDPAEGAVERAVRTAEPITRAAAPVTNAAAPVTNAATPVTDAGEPLSKATDPVTRTVEPVTRAVEPVTRAVEPVTRAAGEVMRATEPVLRATEPAGRTAEALVRTGEPVIRAAAPVVEGTRRVLGGTGQVLSLRPSVTLPVPATPLTDVVRDLSQAGVATQPGSRTTRGGGGQSDAGAQAGGRVSGGGPGDPPGGLGLGIGEQSITTTGAGTPGAGVLPEIFHARPPDLQRGDATPAHPAGSATYLSQALGSLLTTGLETFSELPATFPAGPGSTEATAPSRGLGTAAPDHSAPAPPAPAGPAAAGAAAAGSTALIIALVALLLLAAPSLSRLLRTVPAFLRPAPFISALERPG